MEATQESTQPCTDPRRVGRSNSGLLGEDESDILCILHPNSIAAHEAVTATALLAPQHILQRDDLEYEGADSVALDLALRLSSNVHNLHTGFCFGRNKARCDLLLSPDDNSKRISNTHFRIYVTQDGILMLEDLSTNGTVVDDCRLRKNQKENSRMLTNGSVIQVLRGNHPSGEVRFVVRMPSRDGLAMQYTENLLHYFERVQKHQAGAVQTRARQAQTRPPLHYSVTNAYGMNWTGGSMYNVTGQIGHGAFATVYKLATKQHGIVYAAKELDKMRFMKNGVLDHKVDNELKIMKELRHPNIVQYIDHHEHERWIYIIMEYVPGGELSAYLRSHGKIPEDMVQTLARQILHALNYLHKRRITHRDIKPDNILIASLEPLKVKLSDFGLSKVQDQTFLKTFCGTLLYCAPEVYPEYETYRQGEVRKRRRLGDPPPKTSPYDQSVDMWSFGAVLFHILCGIPPYTGRGDDRGAQMLRTIMTTEPDYDLLRSEGISEAGIDFVAQLLNRDPHSRPKEAECFRHPWIRDVVDVDDYDDHEGDIQPSRVDVLSDIGEDLEDELDASQLSLNRLEVEGVSDESQDLAQSKKPRIDYPPAEIHYPSLPIIESFKKVDSAAESTPRRLFGEITASALRSSNVFGASLDAFDGDDLSVHDFVSSTGESIISDSNSLKSILSLPDNPFSGSAPSLMGAENLVGQLNMNSWHPGTSTHAPPVAAAPVLKTSVVEQIIELARGQEASTDSPFNDVTPKPFKFSRRIELPLTDTASERSSEEATRENTAAPCDNREAGAGEIFDIELAVTVDARTGRQVSHPPEVSTSHKLSDALRDQAPVQVPQPISLHRHDSPRPLLGKLTSLPGSIFDLTIRLEDRMTSWGRGSQATICHPDPFDTRIAVYALEVTFWAPGIESKIAAGQDWMAEPGVMAILSTKARACIWVNDTTLRRGPDGDNIQAGFYYGKLYSGDIITVYKKRNQFLKFRCEFYHGDSICSRPDDEKGFLVQKSRT